MLLSEMVYEPYVLRLSLRNCFTEHGEQSYCYYKNMTNAIGLATRTPLNVLLNLHVCLVKQMCLNSYQEIRLTYYLYEFFSSSLIHKIGMFHFYMGNLIAYILQRGLQVKIICVLYVPQLLSH